MVRERTAPGWALGHPRARCACSAGSRATVGGDAVNARRPPPARRAGPDPDRPGRGRLGRADAARRVGRAGGRGDGRRRAGLRLAAAPPARARRAAPARPAATCSTAAWSRSTPTCSSPTSTRAGARWPAATTKTRRRCSRWRWPGGRARAPSACDVQGQMPLPRTGSPPGSRSCGWWRPRRWPTRTPARAAPRTTSRCSRSSPRATRCASRWPSSSSARSTPPAGRPTRWPPTTAAGGALADELGVEPTPALRQVRAAVLAHEPLPGVGGTVLPTHLPPRNRSFVGPAGPARGRRRDPRRRHPPAARRRADRAGRGRQDRARAGAGPPAAPARPRRLVDLRRRPGRHRPPGWPRWPPRWGSPRSSAREDARAALWAELDRTPGWLLVYDNADEPAQLEPFLPAARHGDVIITSRNPAWRRHRPPGRGRAAGPRGVAGLRRDPHRRPARRGRHPRRAARRPAARTGAGVRLHRADADVAARLRRPVPPPPRRAAAARRRGRRAGRSPPPGGWRSTGWPRGRRGPRSCWRRSPSSPRTRSRWPRWPGSSRTSWSCRRRCGELLRLSLVDREADTVRVHRLVQDVVRARMTDAGPPRPARRGWHEPASRRPRVHGGHDVRPRRRRRPRRAPRRASPGTARRWARSRTGWSRPCERVAARQAERALYPAAEHVLRAALRLHGAGGAAAVPRCRAG